jgi:hypothetical protein
MLVNLPDLKSDRVGGPIKVRDTLLSGIVASNQNGNGIFFNHSNAAPENVVHDMAPLAPTATQNMNLPNSSTFLLWKIQYRESARLH